jgi:hypothetical protein
MANRSWYKDMGTADQGLVCIDGKVNITGSTGATVSDTLTYASASNRETGIYRIQLEDSFVSLKAAHLTLEMTGTQFLQVQLSGSDVSSGKYVDFLMLNSSGVPTKPSVANCGVFVSLIFKNSLT